MNLVHLEVRGIEPQEPTPYLAEPGRERPAHRN